MNVAGDVGLPAAPQDRGHLHQAIQFPGQEIRQSQTGGSTVEIVGSVAADQTSLINLILRKVPTKRDLMISFDDVHIIIEVVRVGDVMSERMARIKWKSAGDCDRHTVRDVGERIDPKVLRTKVGEPWPADDHARHTQA